MSASEQIAVERFGSGPAVLLLHGGAGPELTWDRQMQLAQRWSLIIPTRRGFPRSAPAPRQDFEVDAEDVARLMTNRTHLVGFSYGGLGVTLAAEQDPERVRSLTLIETPLGVADDPSEGDRRSPIEANPDLKALAKAGIPVMVVSGGYNDEIETRSDALAKRLSARREIIAGAGPEVPHAPGFNDVLEDFLRGSAGTARSRTG
jgi:alpha-beta hydrolase superfamily lysophospholipase